MGEESVNRNNEGEMNMGNREREVFRATLEGLCWNNPRAWVYLFREFLLMLKGESGGDDD